MCNPLLDGLERLPAPQAEALGTAFGIRAGKPPDRFLIGLAVLTLLSEHAGDQPVVCLVDDAQWLDQASAQNLAFVARRLAAEPVVMVFAARTGGDQMWAGLPQLTIGGLSETDAAAMLESAVRTPLDDRVRGRILAESRGNPLALLELPRWYSATELTFGPELTPASAFTRRMEEGFRRQFDALPPQTRRLLLIAAAEPLGDGELLRAAAERRGLGMDAAVPAEDSGLVGLRSGAVSFRHPLVRSAVYRSAEVADLKAVHQALADVTDPLRDPDRRAWHRAHATTGPDATVAAELEQSAGRALGQGGLAAAGAFLERAAALTPAGVLRADRAINAAQTMVHAGAFGDALRILTEAEFEVMTELQRARAEVIRAQIGFASNRGSEALPLLLAAARRLEPLDLELALDTYVGALEASLFAGRLSGEPGALEVARAARGAPALAHPRRSDLLLESMAVLHEDGLVAAAPVMRRAVEAFETDDLPVDEALRFIVLAGIVAADLWDDVAWTALAGRHLKLARESGALIALQFALNSVVYPHLFGGDLVGAAALLDEAEALADVAGIPLNPYGAMGLVAFRGNQKDAAPVIEAAADNARARGEGLVLAISHWTNAMLCNGNGDYAGALSHCREIFGNSEDGQVSLLPVETQPGSWALVELVEAAARSGEINTAAAAADLLSEMAQVCGTDWSLGEAARARAQISDGDRAENLYEEAVDRLGRTGVRVELARSQLLYGEWLRRAGRRVDARAVLHEAYASFAAMGVEAFAERARRELAATGEKVHRRSVDTQLELTAQELHIARLAADGCTNAEIGGALYISRHTVDWHMRKVFAKLNVSSRRQLRDALVMLVG
jgi:DNA-binding CsgD family transcriptional regulator